MPDPILITLAPDLPPGALLFDAWEPDGTPIARELTRKQVNHLSEQLRRPVQAIPPRSE